mgnify:FL=1
MFGPNTHIKSTSIISYSHRDNEFFDLYRDTIKKFKNKFNLNAYDIMFIPGSGTVGVESVISTLNRDIEVVGYDGVFKTRWENMVEGHNKVGPDIKLYCHLETSNSSLNNFSGNIADCISSFPYYDIPETTDVFITCANKQLGSFPGLSIVGVKKNAWELFNKTSKISYLNLYRYYEYGLKNQTPSTAPTHLFKHLNDLLSKFDIGKLREKIETVSKILVEAIGDSNIIGEKSSPVITVNKEVIPIELANKYQLYGINTNSENYQFFTYSCNEKLYKKFCKDLCQY